MSFGLRNAAQTFQRFMDEVTRGLDFVYVYIDDILVASTTDEEHRQHLQQLFQRLREFGVLINPAKCTLGTSSVTFLGHYVTSDGISPPADRVQAIRDFPRPNTAKELRRFLGMLNFYRRFVQNAATSQAPLHDLLCGNTKGKAPLKWTPEATKAFEACKQSLNKATTLAHPKPDALLTMATDASDFAVGAVLQQKHEGSWQPLGFFSQKLSPAERKYAAYDRELLAIYNEIKHFRYMIEGRPFTVLTDHKPNTFAFKQKLDKCSPRQFRYLDFIGQFTTNIEHIAGESNVVADALSRIEEIKQAVDLEELARSQENDAEMQKFLEPNSVLQLKQVPVPGTRVTLYCDVSTPMARPYVTSEHRRAVFNSLH